MARVYSVLSLVYCIASDNSTLLVRADGTYCCFEDCKAQARLPLLSPLPTASLGAGTAHHLGCLLSTLNVERQYRLVIYRLLEVYLVTLHGQLSYLASASQNQRAAEFDIPPTG
jgi:hypothetical protein